MWTTSTAFPANRPTPVWWFIEHAPPGFHLALASRTEPNLPVASLRAHGELLELRAADLRFSDEEADAFLNGRLGLDLTAKDVDSLVRKTEGWPAGLDLAALSLQPTADPKPLCGHLAGQPSRGGFPCDRGARGA